MDLSVSDLKEKYELFRVDSSETTEEDVGNLILKNLSYLVKDKSYCILSISKDIWHRRVAKIRNFFGIGFEEEFFIELYERDIEIFDEELELIQQYEYYFSQMLDVLDSTNYQEILKFCDFTDDYYCHNFDFLEAKLDQIHQESRGIFYTDNRTFDTRESFDKFFDWQLVNIVSMDGKEKVKKL